MNIQANNWLFNVPRDAEVSFYFMKNQQPAIFLYFILDMDATQHVMENEKMDLDFKRGYLGINKPLVPFKTSFNMTKERNNLSLFFYYIYGAKRTNLKHSLISGIIIIQAWKAADNLYTKRKFV